MNIQPRTNLKTFIEISGDFHHFHKRTNSNFHVPTTNSRSVLNNLFFNGPVEFQKLPGPFRNGRRIHGFKQTALKRNQISVMVS